MRGANMDAAVLFVAGDQKLLKLPLVTIQDKIGIQNGVVSHGHIKVDNVSHHAAQGKASGNFDLARIFRMKKNGFMSVPRADMR